MKIIVLTNGSSHGLSILKELKKNELSIDSVVIEKKSLGKRELNEFKNKLGSLSFLIKLIPFKNSLYRVFRKLKYNDVQSKELKKYADKVFTVENFNSSKCIDLIKDLAPDLIILGGSRIIKQPLLEIPKIGTLNAHPGILPDYRGVDVVKWALYNDDPVGVTIHFVNSGIDTGEICLKRELIQPGYKGTVEDAKKKAEILAAEMMFEVVNEYKNDKNVTCISNNIDEGSYYKKMPSELNKELINKLK